MFSSESERECSFQILLKLHWDLLRKKQANIQKSLKKKIEDKKI